MTLKEFVETVYVPYIHEKRASTESDYKGILENHIRDRVGHIRLVSSGLWTPARC